MVPARGVVARAPAWVSVVNVDDATGRTCCVTPRA